MEVILNLNNFKSFFERNIFLDLDIELYMLEHYSSNMIKQSKVIEDIQFMINKELNTNYKHHNEIFNNVDEVNFTTKIVKSFDFLNVLFLKAIGIKFKEINFKEYVNKEKLIVKMEVIK